jgi:Domain of unknown function (DUF4189)
VCAVRVAHHTEVMTLHVISRLSLSAKARIAIGAVFAAIAVLAAGLAPGSGFQAQGAVASDERAADQRVNRYAAIHISPRNGIIGEAWRWPSRTGANRAAHRACVNASPYVCKKVVWVRNGCAAVAVRWRGDRVVRWAGRWDDSRRDAIRKALRACKSDGRNCRKRASVCSWHK